VGFKSEVVGLSNPERFEMERTTTDSRTCTAPLGASDGYRCGRKDRWGRFLAGWLVILLFAFAVIPALQRLGPVREVRQAIQNTGIDATALFYTDSDVSSEAEASIRDARRYPCSR
jgi:hypothetical protein